MALTPKKSQISATVDSLTTKNLGQTLYVNKQDKMTFLPIIKGDSFDDFIAETTEVFMGGAEPSISTKAVLYVLVLEASNGDKLPDGWETQVLPMPLSRKWANMLLEVIGDEECPLATITDGKLDTDGTVFKMMKSGTGTSTAYSFMPVAKKFTSFKVGNVTLPEMPLAEWAEEYGERQLKKAGLQSDTAEDKGSEDFEL